MQIYSDFGDGRKFGREGSMNFESTETIEGRLLRKIEGSVCDQSSARLKWLKIMLINNTNFN